MEKFKSYFQIYGDDDTREVFEENEYQANRLSFFVILFCAVILISAWVLNLLGVFTIPQYRMNVLAIQGVIEFAIPVVLYLVFKGRKRWLKYVMVVSLLLVCTRLFSILNHNVLLIMVLPVLLSSRYFSKGFTMIISLLSLVSLAVASASSLIYGVVDLNYYPSPPDGTVITINNGLRNSILAYGADTTQAALRILVHSFIPKFLVFVVITFIATRIAEHGHRMVLDQSEISKATAAVKAELNTATQIQNSMVPSIFPAFPEKPEFDIYASMLTAKEVGGDFYDFFLIDDDHLVIEIADVSGKGVPAALFMMASKILINDRTIMGGTPGEILEFVNNRICANNEVDMFVTVWLGILDLRTGKVTAANAGHEYPVIHRNGGQFEILKDKHSFVVGGMDNMRYKDYEFALGSGDALFLYTDGLTEAHNESEELFGEERMTRALNIDAEVSPEEVIKNVQVEVDKYVGSAERFDDLTMLCLRYRGR